MPKFTGMAARKSHWADLDSAVALLLEIGFAVSIDVHPGSRFGDMHQTDPESAFADLKDLWEEMARRFAGSPPDRVFFELLNEPRISVEAWTEQARRLITHLRAIVPHHTIVYGTAEWQRVEPLAASLPFEDRNIVYAVHFYDPMTFTHQGMDWSPDSPLRHVRFLPFPLSRFDPRVTQLVTTLRQDGHEQSAQEVVDATRSDFGEAEIRASFAPVAAWAVHHGAAVIVNEFGVLSHQTHPKDRARWIAAVRKTAEEYCFGWAHWEFDEGFGMMRNSGDSLELDPLIAEALLEDPLGE